MRRISNIASKSGDKHKQKLLYSNKEQILRSGNIDFLVNSLKLSSSVVADIDHRTFERLIPRNFLRSKQISQSLPGEIRTETPKPIGNYEMNQNFTFTVAPLIIEQLSSQKVISNKSSLSATTHELCSNPRNMNEMRLRELII